VGSNPTPPATGLHDVRFVVRGEADRTPGRPYPYGVNASPNADRFLRACRREPVDRTPVWFMRQAGRYLPEYREVRGEGDILDTCRRPDLVTEITLQPLRRMAVDVAILFSDIMVPLAAVGVPVRIEPGVGPIVDDPIRTLDDVTRLRPLEPDVDVPHVLEAIRLLRKELDVPLLGFAGAPFTLASYLVEGGPSRTHERTKALMLGEPAVWNTLMDALVAIVLPHLRAQVEAGAQALQIFDSWVGVLGPDAYLHHVFSHMGRLFNGLADVGVPIVHFGLGTGELLALMRRDFVDVIGVDWRTPLDVAWDRLDRAVAVQGNLDPAVLSAPWEVVEAEADRVLARAGSRDGHIFNLGHGVPPDTDPDTLRRLVDLVHERTERQEA
jgi:uroporphyrinogen decarboxylase